MAEPLHAFATVKRELAKSRRNARAALRVANDHAVWTEHHFDDEMRELLADSVAKVRAVLDELEVALERKRSG